MKKKILFGCATVLLALLIAVCGYYGYSTAFPVKEDNSNLVEYANHYLNRGNKHQIPYNIKAYDSISLGELKYVLVEIDQQLGELRLRKGLNGNYRVSGASYGGGNFWEEVVEADNKKYYLFGGRNAVWEIARVEVSLDGETYALDIPDQDRFIVHTEIPYETEAFYSDLEAIRFYDADGRDISEQIPWN